MTFQFENLPDLLAMDGHGPYVWAAVVVTILISAWLIISPSIKQRRVMRDIAREAAIENINKSECKGLQ